MSSQARDSLDDERSETPGHARNDISKAAKLLGYEPAVLTETRRHPARSTFIARAASRREDSMSDLEAQTAHSKELLDILASGPDSPVVDMARAPRGRFHVPQKYRDIVNVAAILCIIIIIVVALVVGTVGHKVSGRKDDVALSSMGQQQVVFPTNSTSTVVGHQQAPSTVANPGTNVPQATPRLDNRGQSLGLTPKSSSSEPHVRKTQKSSPPASVTLQVY